VWSGGHFVSSAWPGWVELSLAAMLILLTMHLWIQFFAGCVAFGFLKSVIGTIAGRDWFPPHLAFSRLEAAQMAFFFGATLVWLIRFARARPELADRIAIAVYLFSLWPRNNPHFSIAQAGIGLIALFLAWAVSRWKGQKPHNRPLVQSRSVQELGSLARCRDVRKPGRHSSQQRKWRSAVIDHKKRGR